MMQIALFGTSADPPTAAHQQILYWLSQRFDWVAVWASDNPFKSHQTSLRHRSAMLQLLVESLNSRRTQTPANVLFCPDLSSPRSLVTVEKAQQRWPGAEFTLVIGSDLVNQMTRWYRVEELLEQVKLLVVPRPGYPLLKDNLQQLQQMGAKIAIAQLRGLQLSSTEYREARDPKIVIPPIQAYIHREHLYECQDTPKSLVTQSPSGY